MANDSRSANTGNTNVVLVDKWFRAEGLSLSEGDRPAKPTRKQKMLARSQDRWRKEDSGAASPSDTDIKDIGLAYEQPPELSAETRRILESHVVYLSQLSKQRRDREILLGLMPGMGVLDDKMRSRRVIQTHESLWVLVDGDGKILSEYIPVTEALQNRPEEVLQWLVVSGYVSPSERVKTKGRASTGATRSLRLHIRWLEGEFNGENRSGFVIFDQFYRARAFLCPRDHHRTHLPVPPVSA